MAAGDLTTIEKVKEYLGLDAGQTKDDALLSRLVTAASALFVARTGVDFPSASYTDTVDGNGRATLLLQHAPVTAVASVTVDGETIAARATVDGDGYVIADGTIGKIELAGYVFTTGTENVVVTYTAGEAVPADVEQAVILRVAYEYKARDRISIANRVLPQGESISFVGYDASNAQFDAVCDLYRRPGIG